MAYTLWQSAPLAKKPFKKTLEKLEVWGSVFQRAAYSIFLDQQVLMLYQHTMLVRSRQYSN